MITAFEKFLLGVLIALAAFGLGYLKGKSASAQADAEKRITALTTANQQLDTDLRNARDAAAQSIATQTALKANYDALNQTLQDLRKRAPLVLRSPACTVAQRSADKPADGPPQGRIELPAAPADADAVPVLTLAAVRMWNSALAGTDLGAGACRADAAAEQADAACTQGAGLDLDDAWRNHAVNAQSCAVDRARHQDLIDFLKKREGQRP